MSASREWRLRQLFEQFAADAIKPPFFDDVEIEIYADRFLKGQLPLRVREAAIFLGVSPQTVYLWVERKQIPHLRVMGRNIRFLKSELEPFRAQFKQEIGNGKT